MQRNATESEGNTESKYKQTLSNTHFSTIKNTVFAVSPHIPFRILISFFFSFAWLHMLCTFLVDKTHKIYLKICLFSFSHRHTILCDIALNLSTHSILFTYFFLECFLSARISKLKTLREMFAFQN